MNDYKLLKSARRGNADALITLYETYRERVFAYVYYRTGRQQMVAEEISAETFARLAENLHNIRLRRGKPLLPWLYTVARNLVNDHHRRNSRISVEPPSPNQHAPSPSPETLATLAFDSERVHQALANLSDDQLEVLILRFLQGHSVRESAELMQQNEGNVKTLTRRALQNVRRQLGVRDD